MGVPKFFRYISERYPCLSELVRENQIPEFDNLYLDMNGIIHNCSHPNDADVTFRISEKMIFEGVFQYVEYLFKMIRPQKVFFIAVDGVAPRAKMNQQRGRRFRSAHVAQEQLEKAIKNGEIPSEDRFDSNCITPGTAFMVRLQKGLEHFIQVKMATDILWKACTVILSGHETPGEGEHKIMEYIRHAKAQPGFNPNTRHCLYGLDADLIMLGLCTHERYFSLLREEVKFGKNDTKTTLLQDIRFYLLHLTLLSEYLELEFERIRDKLRFPFDIHKLIDDWILLLYLVGNDFIPHLPHIHINENALPTLYNAYMNVLPEMDGYINEGGILNLPRFQLLMRQLSTFDREVFLERYTDLKYLEEKLGKDNLEAFDVTAEEIIGSHEVDTDLTALIMASELLDSEGEDAEPVVALGDLENNSELFEKEFKGYKRNYYMTKMGYADFTEQVRAEQTECYIRALQWTLHYYYRGVVSWSWYYPYHYAPFISDIDHFADLELVFEMASPFLPFQQLLSVLPAASKSHLPAAYHQLMTNPNSPVYDFYPTEFSTDLNGKQQHWEAVVLIPFIDEKRLLKAMHPCDAFLTDQEKQRNVHGPMLQYKYDAKQNQPLEEKYGFPRVDQLTVSRTDIYRDELAVEESKLVLGPSKGSILNGYAKGFPTFKHLNYHGVLAKACVKVFNFPSKNDSMVVYVDKPSGYIPLDTTELAKQLLGKIVYVSWPHVMEAKVVRVADSQTTYELNTSQQKQTNDRSFNMSCKSITEHNQSRLALNVGPIKQLVYARTYVGTEYIFRNDRFELNKLWNNIVLAYPAQTIVQDLQDVMAKEKPYLELLEMFSLESVVFLRATQSYGSMGQVTGISSNSRVKASFLVYDEPELQAVFQTHKESLNNYRNVNDTASSLGISSRLLLQLTSSIIVTYGGHRSINRDDEKTVNIGLRLRMISKDEEAVGYCRKVNNCWLFSDKTIQLLQAYDNQAPGLFERLETSKRTNVIFEADLFGEGNEGRLQELADWLKKQDLINVERRACGIQLLEEKAVVKLTELIDRYRETQKPKVQTMLADPRNLYRPGMKKAKMIDPMVHFELLDRVIIVQDSEDAPVGRRGTIIGTHRVSDPNPLRREAIGQEESYFEILFDEPLHKGVSIFNLPVTANRVMRIAQGALLSITGGRAMQGYRPNMSANAGANVVENGPKTFTSDAPQQVWIKPHQKATSTAESIQRRVSERIEKLHNKVWNTNTATTDSIVPFTPAGMGLTAKAPQQSQQRYPSSSGDLMQVKESNADHTRKKEFERLWKKLKESSMASDNVFDENDIKSFAQAIGEPGGANPQGTECVTINQESARSAHARNNVNADTNQNTMDTRNKVPKSNVPDGEQKSPKPSIEGDNRSRDNMTGMLRQMLRIDEMVNNDHQQVQVASHSKHELMLPATTSLPKPPIQWQRSSNTNSSLELNRMHQDGTISFTTVRAADPDERLNSNVSIALYGNVLPQPMPPPLMFSHLPSGILPPQTGDMSKLNFRPSMMSPPRNAFGQQPAFYGQPPMMQHMEPRFGRFGNPQQLQQLHQQQQVCYGPRPMQRPNEVLPPPTPFHLFRLQHPSMINEPPPSSMIVQQQGLSGLGPKGPQNLSYNRNNPAGNGAFVPLQAMKQNAKSKPMPNAAHKINNGSVMTSNNVTTKNLTTTQPGRNSNMAADNYQSPSTAKLCTTQHLVGNSFNEKNAHERQVVVQRQAEADKGFAKFLSPSSTNPSMEQESTNALQNAGKTKKTPTQTKEKKPASIKKNKDVACDEQIVFRKKVGQKNKNRIAARFPSAADGC